VPWIIDYDLVLQQLKEQGLVCNYFNSGAFAFAAQAEIFIRGWIGPDDATIKPSVRPLARQVAAPYEAHLAAAAARVWQQSLAGPVWIMPMSHWHYEMNFGSRDWMPNLVESIELDPGLLMERNNAAAIEFAAGDSRHFVPFVTRLLEMCAGSDFLMAFPRRPILCTLHHHKQLWWITTEQDLLKQLDEIVADSAPHPAVG